MSVPCVDQWQTSEEPRIPANTDEVCEAVGQGSLPEKDSPREVEMVRSQQPSLVTIVVAFAANVAVALAKSAAAALTGSAAMVAEAAHSWADTGNQVFLFLADRRSRRPPDELQPLGYGREAYVWSLFAAMGLFVAGGVVSIYHGLSELTAPTSTKDYAVGFVVLGIALILEGSSLVQAVRRTSREAGELGRDTLDHALATSDPTLRAVLAEDAVAVVGILIAAAGMALHQMTGEGIYDALASVAVGLLLCAAAIVLIDRNRRFLTGQVADQRIVEGAFDRVRSLPEVARIAYLRLEFVGPHQLTSSRLSTSMVTSPSRSSRTHFADLNSTSRRTLVSSTRCLRSPFLKTRPCTP